jgi:hypothetical protein
MFTVTVKPEGGEPFDIEVTTRDALKWERSGPKGRRSISNFTDNPRVDDLYSLTFVAVQRDGRYSGDIRQFEEECDLERHDTDGDESDEAGPTQPAR